MYAFFVFEQISLETFSIYFAHSYYFIMLIIVSTMFVYHRLSSINLVSVPIRANYCNGEGFFSIIDAHPPWRDGINRIAFGRKIRLPPGHVV